MRRRVCRTVEDADYAPEMDFEGITAKIQLLSDLEVATLLCLAAKQHCLVETEENLIDDVCKELALIASDVFKLSYAVLSVHDYGSSDGFLDAILHGASRSFKDVGEAAEGQGEYLGSLDSKADSNHVTSQDRNPLDPGKDNFDTRKLVNVVIAKNFDLAPEGIQIQGLELMRLRRMSSHGALYTAPEAFLFFPVISTCPDSPRLNKHLIDHMFISHRHHPEDGFSNLEDMETEAQSDNQSSSSVVQKPMLQRNDAEDTISKGFSKKVDTSGEQDILQLRQLSNSIFISTEVRRYLHNIVIFLRQERGVVGGVSPQATSQFEMLTKYLAPLHGLEYVIPSLVDLAAKKIYPHRLLLCSSNPERERSMQYGSDLDAVRDALEGLTVEDVIESVLDKVQSPL